MSNDNDYWQRIAAEQHAKLIEAREQLARAHSASHQHYAQVRADLLKALETVERDRDFRVRCGDHIQNVVRAAISKAGGGG